MMQNCSCAGCCELVPMSAKYCGRHAMDAPYHRSKEIVHAVVGETRHVSYPTHVGEPEGRKGKI